MTGIPPNDPTVAGIALRARAIAARHRAIILAALANAELRRITVERSLLLPPRACSCR